MKKTLFFDLGNVLIFFDHRQMCRQVASVSKIELALVEEFMMQRLDPYERGHISAAQLHQQLNELSPESIDLDPLIAAVSDIFQPNPPVITLALEAKKNGHPLFLLSNTCDAHFAQVKKQFPFLSAFDGYVLSYEVGARKPESFIFKKALQIADCREQDCFYVDDILPYVQSARSLAIDAEQYTDPQSLRAHLSLRGFI